MRCTATILVLFAGLVVPGATAQLPPTAPAEGEIQIEIPDPVVILHAEEFDLRVAVFGTIQCTEEAGAPAPVVVMTGLRTDAGAPFSVADAEQEVTWRETDAPGAWQVTEELTFLIRRGMELDERVHRTTAVFGVRDHESTTGCTPNGHGWSRGDRDVATVMVPALDPQTAAASENETDQTPGGVFGGFLLGTVIGAVVGAVLALGFLGRLRRPPRDRT